MKKAKKIIIAMVIALSVCLSSIVAYAYFSSTSQSTADAQTGTVQVQLNETFPTTDANGAPINTIKTFSGTNTGNKMAYVRAQIFPAPEYHYIETDLAGNTTIDEWRPLAVPNSDFLLTVTSPDWIEVGDGYLYYSKILNPGDMTGDVNVTIQVTDPSLLPSGMDIRLNVRVVMEAAQAANNIYKTVFGIPALPAGVETVG